MQGINTKNIRPKAIAAYVFLPGVIPRLKAFGRSGFGWLAHLMAVIYYSVRLLPVGHPYINPENVGRFGIRHVIAEAANHLTFKKENIDQILVFFAILMGMVVMFAQFALVVITFIIEPAFAGGSFTNIFGNATPESDIAFMMMDSVFGIPNVFNSCVSAGGATCPAPYPTAAFPSPFHTALHGMFEFYNLAVLIIGVLIFLYYVLIMVGETTVSGTPFGRRFNHIWAPLRLVVALGLLVPINYGLNSAQYIALFSAKLGSNMASNGWRLYNATVGPAGPTGLPMDASGSYVQNLVVRPQTPRIDNVVQFMFLVHACRVGYEARFATNSPLTGASNPDFDPPRNKPVAEAIEIRPYIMLPDGSAQVVNISAAPGSTPSPDWATAANSSNYDNIVIRFGDSSPAGSGLYESSAGGVYPYCGEITIQTTDTTLAGAVDAQTSYYNWVMNLWMNNALFTYGQRSACTHKEWSATHFYLMPSCMIAFFSSPGVTDTPPNLPPASWVETFIFGQQSFINTEMTAARDAMVAGLSLAIPTSLLDRGWGGAGIWYNNIAQWNGALVGAMQSTPVPSMMPDIMEYVEAKRKAANENLTPEERYLPTLANGEDINFATGSDAEIAQQLSSVYEHVRNLTTERSDDVDTTDVFKKLVNSLTGVEALFDMRANENTHPMAQLVGLGKSIVDSAVRNIMISLPFAVVGGVAEAFYPQVGGALGGLSQVFMSFATIGLTIGFILYYVLPFMPFLYFFFALSSWVKGIFEAMVGVPLWALAHLRIDGNGLPSETAMNGYYLVFEIFVRPILIVFGLLAAFGVFTAMVRTLNGVFDLLTENLTGFTCTNCAGVPLIADLEVGRGSVDNFFFLVIYTIMVYMIGTTAFKLIDRIPDEILRWMGAGVKTFNDHETNAIGSLTQYAAFGGASISGQVLGAAQQGAQLAGSSGGKSMRFLIDRALPDYKGIPGT